MIWEFTPNATDKRYGHVLNKHIEPVPDDEWICIRDRDTMYLTDSGWAMERAIKDLPDADLLTCRANRVWGYPLDANPNILDHYAKSEEFAIEACYTELLGDVPGFWWLFPKRVWLEYGPFDDLPVIADGASWDIRFSRRIQGRKYRIDHLYIFHLYRLWKSEWSVGHLY